ncbi:hypothetical protein PR048_007887 [Dryococelus australis]|uniref:DDE-1 domain-containing protein n=1 Tax=Dryococelus australis TaxID=614101 RepID=A0ABQ9HVW0_9NEOP|nr:hypothetical protein PR048_007887 [Dryococelus australis]
MCIFGSARGASSSYCRYRGQNVWLNQFGCLIAGLLISCEKNNISHPFCNETKLASKDWLRGFCRRHPQLTLRCPESTSAACARALNRPVVNKFFSLLREVNAKKQFKPHRIFKVYEISLSTVPKMKKAGRANGFSRKEIFRNGCSFYEMLKQELLNCAPPGSVFACNDSGWMRLEVFSQWVDHFLAHVKPTEDNPALLILDGHLSQTKNLKVMVEATENFVTILCLPPHCTHKLQALAVGVMFLLSHYRDVTLEKWMNNYPGRVVTLCQIGRIFGESYLQACTSLDAINVFRKTGIVP